MHNADQLQKFLAGYRPAPARVTAVLVGGKEHPIAVRNGAHRWKYAAKLLLEMRAEQVRLYGANDEIIGNLDLYADEAADAETDTALQPASSPPALGLAKPGTATDYAIIVNVTADAVVRAVDRALASQSASNKVAFEQLARVAELSVERVASLEGLVQSLIDARAKDLEAREQQAAAEQEPDGADAVMRPLLQGAGAELVNKLPQLLQMANAAGLIGTPPAPAVAQANGTNGAPHGNGK